MIRGWDIGKIIMGKKRARVSMGEWGDWRWQMEHSFVLPEDEVCLDTVEARYPFRATPYYLSLINGDSLSDPIRMQCLPDIREVDDDSGDGNISDPFGELDHMPVQGLIHRFQDRVLVTACGQCAVNCRHCTRKNTLKDIALHPSKEYFQPMLDYIENHSEIREVLVSGGDPLLLETSLLDWLLGELANIEHVDVLRIGTRVPVVLPMRIDEELCDMLSRHRPMWVNTQFNHPVEITDEAIRACEMLLQCGIPVSNQSVLLRGLNDSIEVMQKLCTTLQSKMIRPYYVFQCDPVAGTAHFHTEREVGIEMAEAMRIQVGGLCLPRFVADVPGEKGKVNLTPLDRRLSSGR